MNQRIAPLAAPLVYVQKHHVFAIDRESGRQRWQFSAQKSVLRVLFVDDRVFALDLDCVVYCLRSADGRLLGQMSAGPASAWGAAMLAHDGGIYVATSEGVVAFSMDGAQLWKFSSDDPGLEGVIPGLALPGFSAQPDKKD